MLFHASLLVLIALMALATADDTFKLSMSRITPLSTTARFIMRPDYFKEDVYPGAHFGFQIDGKPFDTSTFSGAAIFLAHDGQTPLRSAQVPLEGILTDNKYLGNLVVPKDLVRDKYLSLSVHLDVKISNIKDIPAKFRFQYNDGNDDFAEGEGDIIIHPALTKNVDFAVAFDDVNTSDGAAAFTFSTDKLLVHALGGIAVTLEGSYVWLGETHSCVASGLQWLTSVSEDKKTLFAKTTVVKGDKAVIECPDLRIWAPKEKMGNPLNYKIDTITKEGVVPAIYDGQAHKMELQPSDATRVIAIILVIAFFGGLAFACMYGWKRLTAHRKPQDVLLGDAYASSPPEYDRMA